MHGPVPGAVTVDAAVLRTWVRLAAGRLDEHRAALDRLNVFPVADADTGTNLYLTLAEASAAVGTPADGATVARTARDLARGALVGARGNSGVIVSQYVGALLRAVARGLPAAIGPGSGDPISVDITPGALANGLREATAAAYGAVTQPVEGTVLTVAAAVDGAVGRAVEPYEAGEPHEAGARPVASVAEVLRAGLDAGYVALERTPDQLPALHAAGVLDAGGLGLLIVLEALAEALDREPERGERRGPDRTRGLESRAGGRTVRALRTRPGAPCPEAHAAPGTGPGEAHAASCEHPGPGTGTPAARGVGPGEFEVMYVVEGPTGPASPGTAATEHGTSPEAPSKDSSADGVASALRRGLALVGESVAVVGGDDLWQAHVHTDRPLDALRVPGVVGARASQIRVRHLAEQAGVHVGTPPGLGLVVVTTAPGLVADLARAGAVVVLAPEGGAGVGAEVGRAVDDTGAARVLVLAAVDVPTSRTGLGPGARLGGRALTVEVLDGLSEIQVVAGTATFAELGARPTGPHDGALEVVREAVRRVRTTAVDAGPDAATLADRVAEVVLAHLGTGAPLVTVLTSEATPPSVVAGLAAVGRAHPGADLVVLPAGTPGSGVVVGVEELRAGVAAGTVGRVG
ncbi:DAK2 domain-containing protein [Actinotalea subterranea]|uniref:DAK2 domain-containing protein n=1 Tax=Actinotalea subterranea TaxID=2607497 RepID=UPI0011EEA669|nr:DAK2 domain-containing protein [Actinotalea subterranea]